MNIRILTSIFSYVIWFVIYRSVNSYTVEPISNQKFMGGESPYYENAEKCPCLYWIDHGEGDVGSTIYRWNSKTNETKSAYIGPGNTGFFIPVKNNSSMMIAGYDDTIISFVWDHGENVTSFRTLYKTNREDQLANDGDASTTKNNEAVFYFDISPKNFTNASTTSQQPVYSIYKKQLHQIGSVLAYPNGLRVNKQKTALIIANTKLRVIEILPLSENGTTATGEPRIFTNYSDYENLRGLPASFTLDKLGNLWIPAIRGGQIAHINGTSGSLIKAYDIGHTDLSVSNCCWGDTDFTTLYCTTSFYTAKAGMNEFSGKVLAIKGLGVEGVQKELFSPELLPDNTSTD